jgi:TolA-binding protein
MAEVSAAAPQSAGLDSEELPSGCMMPGNGYYSEVAVARAEVASRSTVPCADAAPLGGMPGTEGVATEVESRNQPAGDDELRKLRHLVEIQERMLANRDTEVSDLRQQRDWLQRRVERLEEKGERDQILLLSVTQTNRQLVSLQEGKRSTVRQLLEWLGFPGSGGVAPAANKGIAAVATTATGSGSASYRADRRTDEDTIEVREAANG